MSALAAATEATGVETTGVAGASAADTAVYVRGLVRAFGDRRVIDGLDVDIRAGEFVALLGHSGCGKSTLLRILAGLDRNIEGHVAVPRRIGVAFQSPRLMPWKRVWRNVVLGLPGRPDRQLASSYLSEVGLDDLLLLDEPFGALDALTRIKAQHLVAELWQRHGCAVLLVTHDVEESLIVADRVLVMDGGGIAHEVRVELPRPRDVGHPEFVALRTQLLAWLGVGLTGPA
jgi:sulfonate transport system ATP-binding protein